MKNFLSALYSSLCRRPSGQRASCRGLSLHARVNDVQADSWEHPSLVQIWGPRGADYVVPRADVAIFTLGRLPRDPDMQAALQRLASEVHRVLDGRTRDTKEVSSALEGSGLAMRHAAITGRVHIRWDASRLSVIPVDAPDADPESARIELARRFFRWYAPTTLNTFRWWAGVDEEDARVTWDALSDQMSKVDLPGEERWVLQEDKEALLEARPVHGVRLIPHSDPYIKIDGKLVVPDDHRRLEIFTNLKRKLSFWPVSGAIVSDGEIVGSWARQQRRVTLNPWSDLDENERYEAESEALSFPIPGNAKAQVRWA